MKFTKTIRFRLTMWYSVLLLSLSVVFILLINIVVTRYYNEQLVQEIPDQQPVFRIPRRIEEQFRELSEEQRELVQIIRQEDLKQVRFISVIMLIPLTLASTVGGFIISGQMLRPISKLNKATKRISFENLKERIEHEDVGDDISELVNNFNLMIGRLERSFELQKQFIESASHELKTPIAVVQTNLDSLVADPKVPKKELVEALNKAIRSVKSMNSLVEDLLLLSIESKFLDFEEVELIEMIEECVESMSTLAKEYGVELSFKDREKDGKKKNEEFKVMANKFYLSRAIGNLIENGIKYSAKDSLKNTAVGQQALADLQSDEKTNKPPQVTISLNKNKKDIEIIVEDNGVGIGKKDQEKIFERFFRVDKSRSRLNGGSGLGLAIVKKIIEEHDGAIVVESEVGKGSRFIVSLERA